MHSEVSGEVWSLQIHKVKKNPFFPQFERDTLRPIYNILDLYKLALFPWENKKNVL